MRSPCDRAPLPRFLEVVAHNELVVVAELGDRFARPSSARPRSPFVSVSTSRTVTRLIVVFALSVLDWCTRAHCRRFTEARSRNASTRAALGLRDRSSATNAPGLRSRWTRSAGSTRAASALRRSPCPKSPPRARRPIGMPLPRERSRQHERQAVRPRGLSACFRAGG